MPQRASQQKFRNYTWLNKRNRGNWCMKKRKVYRERERLFWRCAKRNHQGRTRTKLSICLRMCVYKKPQSETGNNRLREPHKTRSAKRTSAAEQKREQRSPQKQLLSLLSSCLPHQLTQLQQTSPMLSSTTCQLKPWARACLAAKGAGA
jgi:hypothetical protein